MPFSRAVPTSCRARLPRAIRAALPGLPLALAAFAAAAQQAPADPTTLDNVQVQAPIAKRSQTVTKTDTPLIEVPQSVSVITAQQMRERGIQGIEEAVWYTAGAQGGGYGQDTRSDWLLVRGFSPARYMDGLTLTDGVWTGGTRIEPYGLERLDVLKGPSSVAYGAMPPGGLVNMVSKRPTDEVLREVEVTLGNYDLRQAAFDFGGPLSADGVWSYRLTGLARNSDNIVDYVKDDRYFFAPALSWKPSEDTELTVLARWQKADTAQGGGFLPAAGTVLPNPHGKIPRERYTGEPGWNDYVKTMRSLGYEFRHRFSDAVTFRQNLRYGKVDVDHDAGVGAFGLQDDLRTLTRYYFPLEEESKSFAVDNNVEWKFGTGAWDHTLLAGIDYRRLESDYRSAFAFGAPPLDIFNPVYGAPIVKPAYTSRQDKVQQQLGVYVQDQIRIDRWVITAAGRQDRVRTRTDQLLATPATRERQSDSKFSGRLGVNYLFDSGWAPYLAWSQSFEPTVGVDFFGRSFRPTTGEQIEAGLKFQPASGRALLTLAAYEIKQKNTLTVDPAHTLFSIQQGETRVRGAELEGRWNFANGLSVYGAYTYTDSQVTKTNDAGALGKQIALQPRNVASLGADYSIGYGALSGLGFGAGVRYTGDHYGDTYNQWKTPSYTLFDASVRYDLDAWRFQLNASNLSDKEYVAVCNSATWCYYGYPRTVTASVRYRW
ncbi:iron complex outermembrane recepter protein [Lysobacter sp. yr284]|uniref:TonB-dependent siderophore receptor n=1 Tax=Lysobacter sp. yr284 TaxID=1761791 RepID=UPI00089C020C|nr:TonB-dependent siderophore receptor [Lysobacter sp. yr284]SDZ09264.1 iron complex outermembrane recepter protein [Lysobacter sp. yr284]